jgi:hypothetical protein
MLPIVTTSAAGMGSAKKSPDTAATRSLSPASAILASAIGVTAGRSLDLVLGLSGLERLGEVAPESVKARVAHLQEPADVGRAALVEEGGGLNGVSIAAVGSIPVAR